jgi:isopentenyl diphosphate isomerase/L-lactate dehydrogenase-like FMN-dependent dehydrogenase
MFKGVHFDDVTPRVKPLTRKGIQDEYDIVMVNGTTVAIIEVKLHYHPNDIEKLLNKVKTFRVLFPEYKDYKVMLGLASKTFKRSDIARANELGIGLIEENGDDIQDVNNVAKFF